MASPSLQEYLTDARTYKENDSLSDTQIEQSYNKSFAPKPTSLPTTSP